jgi:2-oxoglutarate dehydrogenase E1 component
MNANLPNIVGSRMPLSVVARAAAASPATGSMASHKLEQQRLIGEAFAD